MHAPLHTKRVRALRSPWVTPQLKKRMHDRYFPKIKATRFKNANEFTVEMLLTIKSNKEQYYKSAPQDNEGDSRKTWRIINELNSRKFYRSSVNEIKVNNHSFCDPQELSSVFNDYFSSIGPKLANKIQHKGSKPSHLYYLKETDHNFELKTTNIQKCCLYCLNYAN